MNRKRVLVRVLLASSLCVATVPGAEIGLATSAQAQASAASSRPMKLLKLTVVGNKQVPTSAIDQAMTVSVGQKVTKADLQANFQAIVGVYRHANVGASFKQRMTIPRPGLVRVEYMITEEAAAPPQAPAVLRLDKVTFEGNKRMSSDKIAAAIKLKPGDVVNEQNVTATAQAIVALYKKAGIGVKVTPSPSYPQPNHVILDYRIAETAGG
ncbi:POTRA domain-containing protein [Lichenicoccus sp.]|uniref:POTRA domain-containing protein n=1 Tax=Lichenicoccus sp. TaxID=2781899 RepID=UPI003D11E034